MGFQTWDISICLFLNLKYADLNHKATMDSLIHEFIPIAFISCLAVALFLFQELMALNTSVPKPHQLCSISTFNNTMIKASMLHFIQSRQPCYKTQSKLINSLHPNIAIQSTLYINKCIYFVQDPVLYITLNLTLIVTNKYSLHI